LLINKGKKDESWERCRAPAIKHVPVQNGQDGIWSLKKWRGTWKNSG